MCKLIIALQRVTKDVPISQDLETVCPKLTIVKSSGILIFKGDHNGSDDNHKHVFTYLKKAYYPYTMPWMSSGMIFEGLGEHMILKDLWGQQ